MKTNKGFALVALLAIIAGVLVVGGGVVYYATKTQVPASQNTADNNYPPVEQNYNPPITNNNNPPTQSPSSTSPFIQSVGFISPTQGSTWTFGSSMSIKIKTSPQWFHCSNGFYLYNSSNQEIGTVGILTETGKTVYSWPDVSKRYTTCGTGVGEIPISVSAGTYKICLKEQNTETGIGNNFYCSGLFTITSPQFNSNNVTDQPAYLIKAYTQNNKNYIDVDYIEVLWGTASLQAQVADDKCPNVNDCYDFPNGYKRNQNPLVRTFEVSSNVPIRSAWNPYPQTNFITFEEFKNSTQTTLFPASPPFKELKVYIRINILNNIVTNIERPYQE